MEAIIAQYGIEILLAVITAGAIGLCKYFHSVAKKYKQRAEQDRYQEEQEHIEHALEPVVADIEELRAYMMTVDKEEKRKMDLIVSSYRFRLVQLCKLYLKQGYMTVEQFEQLSEFYTVYTGLGGNGQAKDFYEKAIKLPRELK